MTGTSGIGPVARSGASGEGSADPLTGSPMADATGAAGGARPPRHPVDPRCVRWWRLSALASSALPLVVAIAAALITRSPWAWAALAGVAVVSVAYVSVMPRIRYRIHRWEITDEAVYTKSGWLTQEWRIAPLSRIQTVDASRGPLQQLLGISTVQVTTASAVGTLDISALDEELAEEVVEFLTRRTQQTPEDGT